MRSTIALWDVVGISGEDFVVAILPLHGNFNFNGHIVADYRFFGVKDLLMQYVSALILELNISN